jgi:hypothetical protein
MKAYNFYYYYDSWWLEIRKIKTLLDFQLEYGKLDDKYSRSAAMNRLKYFLKHKVLYVNIYGGYCFQVEHTIAQTGTAIHFPC